MPQYRRRSSRMGSSSMVLCLVILSGGVGQGRRRMVATVEMTLPSNDGDYYYSSNRTILTSTQCRAVGVISVLVLVPLPKAVLLTRTDTRVDALIGVDRVTSVLTARQPTVITLQRGIKSMLITPSILFWYF
jgi:hypothetical protein